jgi:hypothetical protein
MPVRIIPKRNGAPSVSPKPDELEEGELAINIADGALYSKLVSGEVRRLNPTSDISGIEDRLAAVEASISGLSGQGGIVEYGQWLPQVITAGGTVVQPTVSYNIQYGLYGRVGSMVVVNGRLRCTSTGGSGTSLAISGLPFQHDIVQNTAINTAVAMQGAGVVGFAGGTSAIKPLFLWGASGHNVWLGKQVDGTDDDTSITYFSPSDATGLFDIVFTYTYHTPWQN